MLIDEFRVLYARATGCGPTTVPTTDGRAGAPVGARGRRPAGRRDHRGAAARRRDGRCDHRARRRGSDLGASRRGRNWADDAAFAMASLCDGAASLYVELLRPLATASGRRMRRRPPTCKAATFSAKTRTYVHTRRWALGGRAGGALRGGLSATSLRPRNIFVEVRASSAWNPAAKAGAAGRGCWGCALSTFEELADVDAARTPSTCRRRAGPRAPPGWLTPWRSEVLVAPRLPIHAPAPPAPRRGVWSPNCLRRQCRW